MNWIIENKEWLFSGLLVSVPIAIVGWLISKKNKKNHTLNQKSGKNSINIQSNDSITINGDVRHEFKSKGRK